MVNRRDLFEFMIKQVKLTAAAHAEREPQAFGRWFANMYFQGVREVAVCDGSGDGKVDLLVTCNIANQVRYHVLNTKYTAGFDKHAPVSFYDEITRYWQAFANRANRAEYLNSVVRPELRPLYKRLFAYYDDGLAKLYFVTNHRINEPQYDSVKKYDVKILHLEDILQHVVDHMEGAMPETEPLLLTGISNVLTPPVKESEVPTSIVFARLVDFLRYMNDDPFDLLFARNVRLYLEDTEPNKDIRRTFRDAPQEFAYSNNGITLLCTNHTHDPGKQELLLTNPRVVNGSQTLHSIRSVEDPSKQARVMVRIIEIPTSSTDLPARVEKRKAIIHKISIRSNMQNPIKRWNLVSNDDFQTELAGYFRTHKLYYERRQKEWKQRKMELTGIGIGRGPDIRWMTQLIAAYHYNQRGLGPAAAYGRLNDLFEEDVYSIVRKTTPPMAYQLYLLAEIMERALRPLRDRTQYIDDVSGYIDLCLFSVICRTLRDEGVGLGKDDLNEYLDKRYSDIPRAWVAAILGIVRYIMGDFRKAAKRVKKQEARTLSYSNYFKSGILAGGLPLQSVPRNLHTIARDIRARR